MALSLYDITAPSRRQKARLQGLYEKPKTTDKKDEEEDPQSLYVEGNAIDVAERNPGHHGRSYDQMDATELNDAAKSMNNGNIIERNMGTLAGMLGPFGAGFAFNALDRSLMAGALNNAGLPNPGDYVGGQVAGAANTGMNNAGGVPNPELAGRSDPSRSGDIPGDLDVSPESPGLYSKGGKIVKALLPGNPPGPDNVIVGAKKGERMITDEMFSGFSKPTRAEIEAAMKKVKRK